MRTRIAPTPSGYVHAGNIVNFTLVAAVAEAHGASLMLRIDDLDRDRLRPEYLDDIFRVLEWCGIVWDEGPRSCDEVPRWSQTARMDSYRRARATLEAHTDDFYVCTCSRSHLQGGSPCTCRGREHTLTTGRSCLRMVAPEGVDPVVWRRDGMPAYHVASVVDDQVFDVDLVVRGADLLESTHTQRHLSRFLPPSTFATATVLHHGLITDADGVKLSKSAGASGRPLELTAELRESVEVWAQRLLGTVA